MSPTAVCGPFCGCLSGSALAVDRTAKEPSQSPPHNLLNGFVLSQSPPHNLLNGFVLMYQHSILSNEY
eukprot:6053404-Prymnesium_polylepis.1